MDRRACLRRLAAGALALAAPGLRAQPAPTAPPEVLAALPDARLLGQGRLRYFGLHIYDARLWVGAAYPNDAPAREDYARQPLALELEYARKLVGREIAQRSIDEMERAGRLPEAQAQSWLAFMSTAFPDVAAGDRITGVQFPGASTRFFVNGKPSGELQDAEFTRRFFGIWLAPQTSQPALRKALLGGGG